MVVRGVYTEAEKKMLAAWKERAQSLVGWIPDQPTHDLLYPVAYRVATRELMVNHALAADYKNPLWRDESYARNTRWGSIIAPPVFLHTIGAGPFYYIEVPPEAGILGGEYIGEDWEFFKPIHVNDSFRVWCGLPEITDVTRPGEQNERRFKTYTNFSYLNQRDEVVGMFHRTGIPTILPPGTELGNIYRPGAEYMAEANKLKMKFNTDYVYTNEELARIDQIYRDEKVRGAEIRYWEDVKIGEELQPVVMGPITIWDQVVEIQGHGVATLPMMEMRRQMPGKAMIDPLTNVPRREIEIHLSESVAKIIGFYSTTIDQLTIEHFLGRLVTNWMGDDGFLRRLNWIKLLNTPLGDTIFGRGRVVNKYIGKNGDYLVDIDTRMETIRGYISNLATLTVTLMSREKGLKLS
jgi:acyl dehydratase